MRREILPKPAAAADRVSTHPGIACSAGGGGGATRGTGACLGCCRCWGRADHGWNIRASQCSPRSSGVPLLRAAASLVRQACAAQCGDPFSWSQFRWDPPTSAWTNLVPEVREWLAKAGRAADITDTDGEDFKARTRSLLVIAQEATSLKRTRRKPQLHGVPKNAHRTCTESAALPLIFVPALGRKPSWKPSRRTRMCSRHPRGLQTRRRPYLLRYPLRMSRSVPDSTARAALRRMGFARLRKISAFAWPKNMQRQWSMLRTALRRTDGVAGHGRLWCATRTTSRIIYVGLASASARSSRRGAHRYRRS